MALRNLKDLKDLNPDDMAKALSELKEAANDGNPMAKAALAKYN